MPKIAKGSDQIKAKMTQKFSFFPWSAQLMDLIQKKCEMLSDILEQSQHLTLCHDETKWKLETNMNGEKTNASVLKSSLQYFLAQLLQVTRTKCM
jgi:hypothetical protein